MKTNLEATRYLTTPIILLFFLSGIVWAQNSDEPDIRDLTIGQTIERDIKAKERQFYTFNLKKDDFVRIEIEGKNADINISSYNMESVKLNWSNFTLFNGKEIIFYQTVKDEEIMLFITTGIVSSGSKYKLSVELIKKPSPSDFQKQKAQKLMEAGIDSEVKNTAPDSLKAIDALKEASEIWEATGESYWQAVVLGLLGRTYLKLGEFGKALETFKASINASEKAGTNIEKATALVNIGIAYNNLGEFDKAMNSLYEAFKIYHLVNDKYSEARTLNNLGLIGSAIGMKAEALLFYEKAHSLMLEVDDKQGQVSVLNNIGEVNYTLNQNEKALASYLEALNIAEKIGERQVKGVALNNVALVYRKLKDYQKATEYLQKAIPILREIGDRFDEAIGLSNLMFLWQQKENRTLAVFYGKQAINRFQELRGTIANQHQDTQKTFLDRISSHYRLLADILVSLGRLPEAQQVLGLLKEQEYLSYVRGANPEADRLKQRADLTPSESEALKQYDEIASKITALGIEFSELDTKYKSLPEGEKLSAQEQARYEKLTKDLETANQAYQVFLRDLSENFKSSKRDKIDNLGELQGLQADLSNFGEAAVAIQTIVSDNRYSVILTTPTAQVPGTFEIKAEDLNRKIDQFRQAIQNPDLDPRPLAKELYDILIKPIEEPLKNSRAKTIFWSLDGSLRYLPIAALHDGKQYLVEKYRNVIFTLASRTRLTESVNHQWRGLALGVSQKWGNFKPLPAVPNELLAVIKDERKATDGETGVISGRRLLDSEFTETSLKDLLGRVDAKGKKFNVVHLASHFALRPGDVRQSFLLLGDGNQLTLEKVNNSPQLRFDGVELLTLSACETGVGESNSNGDEVESFGVIAQKRGAKAVMASLWSVADDSTRELMTKFYGIYISNPNITKAEALQAAQIALLNGNYVAQDGNSKRSDVIEESNGNTNLPPFKKDLKAPFAHPFYWAAFVLIGNGK